MKLIELIQEYEASLGADAEKALAAVDWNYDVDPFDERRYARGGKTMLEAQLALKDLHDKSPEVAARLWEKHCPYKWDMNVWMLS